MYYVDSNLLISYVFSSDVHHGASKRLLENLKNRGLYASSFVLLETCNVVCRRVIVKWKLAEPLQTYLEIFERGSIEDKYKFLISLTLLFLCCMTCVKDVKLIMEVKRTM